MRNWLRSRGRAALTALAIAALLTAGYGEAPESRAPTTSRQAAGAGELPFDAGQLARTRRYAWHGRPFYLFVPKATAPTALFLVLHGLSNTPGRMASDSRYTSYAQQHGFAVAYPYGGQHRGWNAGGCCRGIKTDDVGYLVGIVAEAAKIFRLDRQRVYVVGFSNGGMMALRAACERPDIFAGAGVMSGALVSPCRPQNGVRARPLHVRQLHGTQDRTIPPQGGATAPFVGIQVRPISQEQAQLPPGTELSLTLVPGLAHYWATTSNSGVDATSVISQWLLSKTLALSSARSPQLPPDSPLTFETPPAVRAQSAQRISPVT